MAEIDGARIFSLSFQLFTETLTAASPGIEALNLEAKEFFILNVIEDRPYPAELARHLSMPKPTITLYLKNLQAKGLIGRTIDEKDMRRHRLDLTAAGRATLAQAHAILSARYDERLSRLTEDQLRQFATLLEALSR